MKMIFSVGRCLKRKTMLEWVRQYIIKNFAACKILCNLQELYTAFKEKHPNINIGFSNFLCLEAQMVCCGCLKNDSLCLRLYRSSKCCVASRCNGLELDIQKPDKINFVLPYVFPFKLICHHFYITIIHISIFKT